MQYFNYLGWIFSICWNISQTTKFLKVGFLIKTHLHDANVFALDHGSQPATPVAF